MGRSVSTRRWKQCGCFASNLRKPINGWRLFWNNQVRRPVHSELFNNARGDYTTGNYPLAVKGFTAFLSASPKASNAALAQYYLGEALRLDGRFDQALVAYDRLIVAYPTSEEVPNARLRRAEVLNQLGRVAEAKAAYEIVLKESPNSEAAVVAKQRLTALGR